MERDKKYVSMLQLKVVVLSGRYDSFSLLIACTLQFALKVIPFSSIHINLYMERIENMYQYFRLNLWYYRFLSS